MYFYLRKRKNAKFYTGLFVPQKAAEGSSDMFMKVMIASTTENEEEYRGILKNRQIFHYVMIVLGLVCIGGSIFMTIGKSKYFSDFLSGVYCGVGAGTVAASILFLIKNKKVLTDGKKLREKRLQEQDERNRLISSKTVSTSSLILIALMYAGLMVSGIFSLTVFWTLWIVLVGFALLITVLYQYYSKKL